MLSFGEYRKCSIRMKNRTIFTKICERIPFSGLQYQNNISYCSDVKCHKYEVPKFSWIKEGKKQQILLVTFMTLNFDAENFF